MTALVSTLSELAALLFNTLRLPALLPALAFNVANVAFVLPHLRNTGLGDSWYDLAELQQVLVVLLCTVLLAYLLDIINYSLIRWLEGYPWLHCPVGSWLRAEHRKRHERLESIKRGSRLGRSPQVRLSRSQQDEPTDAVVQGLYLQEFTSCYPVKESSILPTRFGNIIAAAEDYPREMYQINSVALWPLLAPILTKTGYARFVEYEKAALDFVLNSLVLSVVLGGEIVFCGALMQTPWLYVAAEALGALLVALILYELSLSGAMGWGATIRASFDLHREQLRQATNLRPFDDFDAERISWRRLSEFVSYRDHAKAKGRTPLFEYPVPEGQATPFSVAEEDA
jgi:hypothetical protein